MALVLLAGPAPALADAPPYTAAEPGDTRPVETPDPRVAIPTDTVVSPPAADFVREDVFPNKGFGGARVTGPNVAWGWISWDGERSGAASDVHVTYISKQTGWRFATVADRYGRFRLAVPDGTYDILLEDPRLPHGIWTRSGSPYSGGLDTWNGGMSTGMGLVLIPRPVHSCRSSPYDVLDGVDGWAPGANDTNTPCVVTPEPVDATPWGPDLAEWAVTGKDRGPTAKSSSATPNPFAWLAAPATQAPAPALAATAVPRLARTVRLRRSGATAVRVSCPTATTCAGRVTLLPRSTTGRPVAGRILASGVLRAGARTVRLRPTTAGRRALRRGSARASVVWTPTGGTAAVASTLVLRAATR